MDIQKKLLEECYTMISYLQKHQKELPSQVSIQMEIAFSQKHVSSLQKLHSELQKLISPALLENLVKETSFFSLTLTRFSLVIFTTGFIGFLVFSILASFNLSSVSITHHGILLSSVFVANSLYLLYELKDLVDDYALTTAIKTNLWLRFCVGIFPSVVLVELIFTDVKIMQQPLLVTTLFVFLFPFAIFHIWDISFAFINKIFFAEKTDVKKQLMREIMVLHRYFPNSEEAYFQCYNIQNFLREHGLLDEIEFLDEYAKKDTDVYLKLLLSTHIVENKVASNNDDKDTNIDAIVDVHIQKTLRNLRENKVEQNIEKYEDVKPKKQSNEIFEKEFVRIRNKKNAKSCRL
ncbi:hypothetical protein [Candidatus Uabimicrobium sp. HlEnr_7]|uniref:hypothetical protein n=1 Tax=Candidatus Uabimicrobium helgolandensis TaxID=3095367 RepID=UPI003557D138